MRNKFHTIQMTEKLLTSSSESLFLFHYALTNHRWRTFFAEICAKWFYSKWLCLFRYYDTSWREIITIDLSSNFHFVSHQTDLYIFAVRVFFLRYFFQYFFFSIFSTPFWCFCSLVVLSTVDVRGQCIIYLHFVELTHFRQPTFEKDIKFCLKNIFFL